MFDVRLQNCLECDPSRIVALDFHPTKPWVVFGNEHGIVRVWNYENGSTVFTFSSTHLEQNEKEMYNMYSMLEKDPTYMGPKRLEIKEKTALEKKKYGAIKCLKFIDQDVRFMKYQYEKNLSSFTLPKENELLENYASDWPHLVVVCYEHKIVLFDYVSYDLKEMDLFDNKMVHCIEAFAQEDYIAFGCSDGVVRLWDAVTKEVVKTLQASPKHVFGMHSYYEHDGSFLCVVGVDGSVSKWKVSRNSEPILDSKSPGFTEVYDFSPNGIDRTLNILTEKYVIVRDYINDIDVTKVSLNAKSSFSSIYTFSHPKYPSSSTILLSKDGKTTYYSDMMFHEETLRPVITCNQLPKREKAKFTCLSVHPLQPYRIALASNTGISIILVNMNSNPNFCVLAAGSANTSKILYPDKNTVYSVSIIGSNNDKLEVSLPNEFYKLSSPEELEISVSPTQSYFLLHYPTKQRFDILSIADKKVVESGKAVKITWKDRGEDKYAFIEPEIIENEDKKKKKEVQTKKNVSLKLKVVGKGSSTLTVSNMSCDSISTNWSLFGGFLLSVGTYDNISPETQNKSNHTIQFYSWDGDKIGFPLPAPMHVSWDPYGKYCLLTYERYFCIFETKPKFKLLSKNVGTIISLYWYDEILFYSTCDHIHCLIVDEGKEAVLYDFPREAFTSLLTRSTQQNIDPNSAIVEVKNNNLVLLGPDYQIVQLSLGDVLSSTDE